MQQIFQTGKHPGSPVLSVEELGVIYIFTQMNIIWKLMGKNSMRNITAFRRVIQMSQIGSQVLRLVFAFVGKGYGMVKASSIHLWLHIPLPSLSYYQFWKKNISSLSQLFACQKAPLSGAALKLGSKSKECEFRFIELGLLQILEKFPLFFSL